ncbi:non-homologous end joining protein Ku [Actinophytocola gossypii]|uniref:Non-homologous end joining protein Ku n=1 Tax=Actinophytocola gossypii TaxID=2812003 RepID=A0ABT2JIL8_9PSEU|nr:Ku protein [Actinophytocola gossypii]MCT2587730.1 Ku protein [Actinophytocola gossypii]
MRSVWNGSIRIGAANIPVRAYGATEEQVTGMHQLHLADGGRIRHRKVCEVDGEPVPAGEVARGYVMPGGETVMLTEDDLSTLPLSTSKAIEVQSFAPLAEVDPVYLARAYHLEPEPAGTKPYVLFSEALQQSGRVAIVKVALRQRESLGLLRVREQVIVLETMLWPDEIRSPEFPFLHQDVDIAENELAEAVSLIDALSERFTPARYTDRYAEALRELVRAKIEGDELVRPTAARQDEGAADLLTALRGSLSEKQGAQEGAVANAQAAADRAAEARTKAARAASRPRASTRRR